MGRRLCVRDIFTEKVISGPSFIGGYLGEKFCRTMDKCEVLRQGRPGVFRGWVQGE